MRFFHYILLFLFILKAELYAQNLPKTHKIIVKLRPQTNLTQENLKGYFEIYSESIDILNIRKKFPHVNANGHYGKQLLQLYEIEMKYDVDSITKLLKFLNRKEGIIYAEPIYTGKTQGDENTYYPSDTHWKSQEWYFDKIRLYESWKITQGDSSVVIGIIDTGFELDHIDLTHQWAINHQEKYGLPNVDDDGNGKVDDIIGWDFGDQDNDPSGDKFTANASHGTQVAGVASAQTDNREGISGVGFRSRMMPLKVYNKKSKLSEDMIYDAMVYGAENGCSILNISIISTNTKPLQWQQEVINYVALEKGVMIVAAAGNNPQKEVYNYPASYRHVLSISGVDRTDEKLLSYPYNRNIDLVAPAVNITVTEGTTDYLKNFRGTSFSTPLVAGAGALMKAKYPHLTGLQIAELLRITSDSIYHLKANQDYFEQLGHGRLNIYNALTQYDSVHSVRVKKLEHHTKFGKYAFRKDTVSIDITFTNFLQPLHGLEITLETKSPYVHFLKQKVVISDTMKSLENFNEIFKFYLLPHTPATTNLEFRIRYRGNKYDDYEYFTIKTSPDFFVNEENPTLNVTATSNGRIGYADQLNQRGQGIIFKQQSVLKNAGIILGVSPHKLSSSIARNMRDKLNNFEIRDNIRILHKSDLQTTSESSFTDNTPHHSSKVGVNVHQKVTTKNYGIHRNYTVIEYDIENLNKQQIQHLQIGIYADWQIETGHNKADWDKKRNFGYVYDKDGIYFGIKAFGESYEYTALNVTSPEVINIVDGFSDLEKYISMSQGVYKEKAGYRTAGKSDVAHIVATRLSSIPSNGSKSATFVIAGASNLQELQQIFDTVSMQLNKRSSISPVPKVDTVLCYQEKMYITPSNGSKFAFYDVADMRRPIYVGDSLEVTPKDTANVYYIINVDSVRESQPLKYQFKTYLMDVKLDMAEKINLRDSSVVHFYDHTPDVINRIWDFGDGSKPVYDEAYPTHQYRKLGTYDISLTVTKSNGCTRKIKRRLHVINLGVSPQPNLVSNMSRCVGDTIRLAPDNGKMFKFYSLASYRKGRSLHEGSEWFVTASLDHVLVVNYDSVIKSRPSAVYIDWKKIKSDFTYISQSDTLWNAFITFEDRTVSEFPITERFWDFGDKTELQHDSLGTISHKYTKPGVYQVKLHVINSEGCTDSITHQLVAGSKSLKPMISDTLWSCLGNKILLRPEGGENFNFYADSSVLIHSGKEILLSPDEYSRVHITNIDSVLESDTKTVILRFYNSKFDFNFPNPLERANFKIVQFHNQTKNLFKSHWDFGDGHVSNEHHPTHHYNQQGNFQVTLKTVDSIGCEARIEKTIQVFSESPIPEMDSLMRVCQNSEVVLKPSNGNKFRFYRSSELKPPFYTGKSLILDPIKTSTTYYITNVDSVLESKPKKVVLELSKLQSGFTMSANLLDLKYAHSLRIRANDAHAKSWTWNFGNGQTGTGRTVFPKYNAGGIYRITLNVIDQWGCEAHSTQRLVVAPKLQPSSLHYMTRVAPNPTKNKQLFVRLEPEGIQDIEIQLYNILGDQLQIFHQKIYGHTTKLAIDMQNYPKGLYIVKLSTNGETARHKFILD